MFRFCVAATSIIVCGALAEASACTFLPPSFKPGSAEAAAEERANMQEHADAIAKHDLIFVGKVVAQRQPDLAEINAGINGHFTTGATVTDLATGASWPDTFIPGWRSWFEPVEVLKGKPDQPTTNIFSGDYGSSCGPGPKLLLGDSVVVYANMEGGYWIGETATLDLLPLLRPPRN